MPKFQVLQGRHITSDVAEVVRAREASKGLPQERHVSPRERVYFKGDVIEAEGTEADVLLQDGGKFRLVAQEESAMQDEITRLREENARLKAQQQNPVAEAAKAGFNTLHTDNGGKPPDALDRLTVAELRAHADAEEIDVKGATTKEALLKAIRAAK